MKLSFALFRGVREAGSAERFTHGTRWSLWALWAALNVLPTSRVSTPV